MGYETSTLLGVVDRLDRNTPFILDLLFPEEIRFDTEEIDFDAIDSDYRLAPFVSPMKEGRILKERGSVLKKFSPAYIKPKTPIKPNRPLKRKAGEGIGGTMSAESRRDAIVVDIFQTQRDAISRRWEWMAVESMRTGKVIVEGEDYPSVTVDFGRDASNTVTLVGTAQWTDYDNSEPLDDLQDWMANMEAPCTHIVMRSEMFNIFARHPKVKDLIDTRRGSDTKFEMAPSQNLAAFRGRLGEGGPEIWTYDGFYKDDQDAKQYFLPADEVNLVSTAVRGVRAFGAIHDPEAGYMPVPIFPKTWTEKDPGVEYAMSQSAPLMIPRRVNGTHRSKVR